MVFLSLQKSWYSEFLVVWINCLYVVTFSNLGLFWRFFCLTFIRISFFVVWNILIDERVKLCFCKGFKKLKVPFYHFVLSVLVLTWSKLDIILLRMYGKINLISFIFISMKILMKVVVARFFRSLGDHRGCGYERT